VDAIAALGPAVASRGETLNLAMNMLLWTDDVTDPKHHELFELLADAGFDGVEVPIFALDPAPYERLAKRLRELGLAAQALTAPGPGTNPISADPDERKRALERNLRALECAHAVGAEILGGTLQAAPTVFSGEAPTAAERGWAVESLRALAEAAEPLGVTLAVESLNHFEHYLTTTAAETAALCRTVDHPHCRMLYDTFHAHIEEKDVRSAIEGCADVLAYVHLSESDRSTPGSGQVAWASTFAALQSIGYDGWFTVEAFGVSHPELARQMRIWRPRFESEEQLVRDTVRFARGAWTAAGGA
jgi:D-psicose/D-tagatose/L-ribulose 3-epimerase